jgi:hypothetical protein
MPSRVIREGLLDSQRYWGVTVEARQLFLHLLLLADDFGLVSLAPTFIRRRCFDDAPAPAKIDKLLEQLADADLIRVYQAEAGSPDRHAFIPRFRQRLRLMRCKHPPPPEQLYADDDHARTIFNENRHKFQKMTGARQPYASQASDTRRPEVEVKKKGKEVESKTAAPTADAVQVSGKTCAQWAEELRMIKQPGEHDGAFQARVLAAVIKSKETNER